MQNLRFTKLKLDFFSMFASIIRCWMLIQIVRLIVDLRNMLVIHRKMYEFFT